MYLIHAADGFLPSDLATGLEEEIEEELRLAYVALTRAKTHLVVTWPLRSPYRRWGLSDAHGYTQLSRFFTEEVRRTMEEVAAGGELGAPSEGQGERRFDAAARIRARWA